jgi:hypothetical protein
VLSTCHPSTPAPDRVAYYRALKQAAPRAALPAPEARVLAATASGPAATAGLGSRRRQAAAQPIDYAKMAEGEYERPGRGEPLAASEPVPQPQVPKPKRRPGRPPKPKPEQLPEQPPEAGAWGSVRYLALKHEGGGAAGPGDLQQGYGGSYQMGQPMEVDSGAAAY